MWLQASARKDSPSEPLAGGNSRKHLDFVIITVCHCRSCWHPDSNRITVIEQTSGRSLILFLEVQYRIKRRLLFLFTWPLFLYSSCFTCFEFFIFFTSPCKYESHSFLVFTIITSPFASSSLALRQKNLAPIPDVKKKKKLLNADANVILTPWQLLIWWFIAPEHVYMVVCYGMCCWPGSVFMSAPLTTSLSWWKKDLIPYRMHLMVCMCTDEILNLRGSAKTVDKNSINVLKENLSRSQPQEPQKSY